MLCLGLENSLAYIRFVMSTRAVGAVVPHTSAKLSTPTADSRNAAQADDASRIIVSPYQSSQWHFQCAD